MAAAMLSLAAGGAAAQDAGGVVGNGAGGVPPAPTSAVHPGSVTAESAITSSATAKQVAAQKHRAARAELQKGNRLEACRLYRESQALDPSATTLACIAECLESETKLASALSAYMAAKQLVPGVGEVRWKKIDARLDALIERLKPRVPRLQMHTELAPGSIELALDGVAISSEAALGEGAAPLRVDPGPHTLEIRAEGFLEQRCELAAVEAKQLELEIVAGTSAEQGCHTSGSLRVVLAARPEALASPPVDTAVMPPVTIAARAELSVATTPQPPGVRVTNAEATSRQDVVGWAVGGAGVVVLGVAAYFGLRTLTLVHRADCTDAGDCSARGVNTMQEANGTQKKGFVALAVGGALVGAGLTLLVVPPIFGANSGTIALTPSGVWMHANW